METPKHTIFFDKFTANLFIDGDTPVLTNIDWKNEIGNVIIKPQGEQFPLIAVNESFCLSLAHE